MRSSPLARVLAFLAVALLWSQPAFAWFPRGGVSSGGGGGGGGGGGAGVSRQVLSAQFSGFPQSTFFPLATYWPLSGNTGTNDNITAITKYSDGTTLTTFPTIANFAQGGTAFWNGTTCTSGTVTLFAASGTEITGAANMGANTLIGMNGQTVSSQQQWPEGVGCDEGELAGAAQSGLYVMGGNPRPSAQGGHFGVNPLNNTSYDSVASILSLASATGYTANIIGYYGMDEPLCGSQPLGADSIGIAYNLKYWDANRPVILNQIATPWVNPTFSSGTSPASVLFPSGTTMADGTTFPNYQGQYCLYNAGAIQSPSIDVQSAQASSIFSVDNYAQIKPRKGSSISYSYQAASDYSTKPNDWLWMYALTPTQMAVYKGANQPIWLFIEGSNTGKTSPALNTFSGTTSNGSTTLTLTNTLCAGTICNNFGPVSSGCTVGTAGCSMWLGLGITDSATGNCIPAGTTITAVLSSTTATMSNAATCSSATGETITINSNPDGTLYAMATVSGCRWNDSAREANLCHWGNRYRTTGAEVNSEAWLAIIAGATGLAWFPQDDCSSGWSYGANRGGSSTVNCQQAAANWSLQNVQYVNKTITAWASQILAPFQAQCTMDVLQAASNLDSITSSCTNGILTMASPRLSYPGEALLTKLNNVYYLFAAPLRCSDTNCKSGVSWDNTAGGAFTFTLAGLAGKTAKVVYDSNSKFDVAHDSTNSTFVLDGSGKFSDTLGANSDSYEIKIYSIQ